MISICQGHGGAVVFLHGWGGGVESFALAASSLYRDYTVVRYALPGFGASDPPDRAWGVQDYADCVAKDLLDREITECVLVGHSFGGRVAIELAGTHPQLVKGLILVDSAGIRPKLSLAKRYRQWRYRKLKSKGADLSKFGSADWQQGSSVMRDTLTKVVNYDQRTMLPLIQAPTMIVWGRKDRETPLKMGRMMKREIRDSALIVLDGGHFCYLDQPYTFIRIVGEFLKGVEL